jgi:hypothetical protein
VNTEDYSSLNRFFCRNEMEIASEMVPSVICRFLVGFFLVAFSFLKFSFFNFGLLELEVGWYHGIFNLVIVNLSPAVIWNSEKK